MTAKLVVLCFTMLMLTTWAAAQRPAAQPTKASTSTSTNDLAATLKLIQDRINEQGEIRYTMISENSARGVKIENKYAVLTGHAVADAGTCTLTFSGYMKQDGKVQSQGRDTLRFRDITALAVKSQTWLIGRRTAMAGVTGWKGKVSPESYGLQTMHHGRMSSLFFFHKEETANQVAEAMSRATKLCGGIAMLP